MAITAIIGGEEKTGKTVFALTAPAPVSYIELDIGGYDRAIGVAKSKFHVDESKITRIKVSNPLQRIKIKQMLTGIKTVEGAREAWIDMLQKFVDECDKPLEACRSIVFDTWSATYELDTAAYLQELQEKQLDKNGNLLPNTNLRTSLLQIEYKQPYDRLRSMMFYTKGDETVGRPGKNLFLIVYDKDEYKQQFNAKEGKIESVATGRKIYGGWSETAKHADIAFWMTLEKDAQTGKSLPAARITLPGLAPIDMVDTVLPNNCYADMKSMLEMIGGVKI